MTNYLGSTGACITTSWALAGQQEGIFKKLGYGVIAVCDTVAAPVEGLFNIGKFKFYEGTYKAAAEKAPESVKDAPWWAKPTTMKVIGGVSLAATATAVGIGIYCALKNKGE